MNFLYIGKPLSRIDAKEKITGKTKYIDDFYFDGCLYAKTVRAPYPYMKINSIREGEAKTVNGFFKLITSKDIPGKNLWPFVINDYPFLAEDVAKFQGQPIAIVLADSPLSAKKSAEKIQIDYKKLTPIFDPEQSMNSKIKIYGNDNIFSKYIIKKGNIEKVLNNPEFVTVTGRFKTNYQVHIYLEPQGIIAHPRPDGGITVLGSMQCPFYVLDAVCAITGLPKNKVDVIQTPTGGGFGGKEDVPALVAAHAALCCYLTAKPVKLIYDRTEDFISMSKRHPAVIYISYVSTKKAELVGCKVKYILDAGAYSTLSPIVLWRGTVHATGPYEIPNVLIESYAVATNKVPPGAFRGFGQPQVQFANESLIDDLADILKIDPLEFRLKNCFRIGDKTATNQILKKSVGIYDCLLKLKTEYKNALSRKKKFKQNGFRYGIGISANFYGVSLGARGRYLDRSYAVVSVQPDGSVSVSVGLTEIGQGAKTVLAQIAAETLKCNFDDVVIYDVDTSKVLDSGPTVASRTTLMSGNAIIDACKKIKEKLQKIGIYTPSTFKQIVKEAYNRKLKLSEVGFYNSPPTSFNFDTDGQGDAYVVYSYSANLFEVKVDEETFEVFPLKVTSAHDFGTVINPATSQAQIDGGILQGIGYSLYENLVLNNGEILNPNLTDYIIPSTVDTPEMKTYFVEKKI